VSDVFVHSVALMGTVVTFQIVGFSSEHTARVTRAVEWFRHVEQACNRFDPTSELCRLSQRVGVAVPVSNALLQSVWFALAVAEETDGAFDPTVGRRMAARGFDKDYRTGARADVTVEASEGATYRDVTVDIANRTITLHRPLLLDLGAVAKGLAIDMAARELAPFENFAIDAGGDLYFGGHNRNGEPWSAGIRHPRTEGAMIETLRISNSALCTSGDYERRTDAGHHIIDPRTGDASIAVASATVQAPFAMVADGLATAAFVLGPERGIALLEKHGVKGMIITPSLDRYDTFLLIGD
jgi:thiamine biosynthesis lipoprotein